MMGSPYPLGTAVREQLKDSYSDTGRPSIDPELLLHICSDRQFVPHQQACGRLARASGMALVHRARFRSEDSTFLQLFEEWPWAFPGIGAVRSDVRTHCRPVIRRDLDKCWLMRLFTHALTPVKFSLF
jgi:hypothetical protein